MDTPSAAAPQHLPEISADETPESIRTWSLDRFRSDLNDNQEQQAQ